MAVSDQAVATGKQLDQLCINTIRTLSIDAVQKANSGHPGAPMALAPVAYCLWQQFLRYDPADPHWPNRDRFILSNGHASMLLYSLLHLAGVREVNAKGRSHDHARGLARRHQEPSGRSTAKRPAIPNMAVTTGVETTTGPLGQGVANSVGMAIAERWLAAHFNRPGFELFGYNIWAICGDGDMMEGISSEAASVAGHLRLSNLCWIYDNNHITIEGKTDLSLQRRCRGALQGLRLGRQPRARRQRSRRTGQRLSPGTRHHGSAEVHYRRQPHRLSALRIARTRKKPTAKPLGEEEVKLTKRFYGWPEDAKFLVPDGVRENFRDGMGKRGAQLSAQWRAQFKKYSEQYPDLADQFTRMQQARTARRLGQGAANLPGRCQRTSLRAIRRPRF